MIVRGHSGPQPHSPASVQLSEEVPHVPGDPLHPGTVAVPHPLFPEASARRCLHQPLDPLEPLELPGRRDLHLAPPKTYALHIRYSWSVILL